MPDIRSPAPVFVVSAGRSGSAMLSSVLNTNPNVLSISEYFRIASDFGAAIAACFPEGQMSGAQFAEFLQTPPPRARLLLQHGLPVEEGQFQPGANSRWGRHSGVPPLLLCALPHLTTEAETLFNDLLEHMQAQPVMSAAAHHAHMFDWLRQRFGRKLWLERSGGSLRMVSELYKAFPNARFIHLVRDGRNVAISMSQNYGYRMLMLGMQLRHEFGADPFAAGAAPIDRFIPDKWRGLTPQDFDAAAFRQFQVPVAHCGQFWSNEIRVGLRQLEAVPASQKCTMRYEDFLSAPEQTVAKFAFWLDKDIVSVDWIRKAALKIRSPRSSWTNLDSRQRAELDNAVRGGGVALGDLYR
ncbi:sulfotransferase [Massilia sp. W12]|uniref:sulfotransferase family protein n=1 Tax=Massilia sp. W12 TaxID=3126507 RepID=UPI0030D1CDA7